MQVFICYASENAKEAEALATSLDTMREVRPWLDRRRLMPGVKWEDEILNALDESQAVVILLSAKSVVKTGFVQKEIKYALDLQRQRPPGAVYVIPARLDSCEVPYRELRELQRVDLFPDWHRGVEAIVTSLQQSVELDLERAFEDVDRDSWVTEGAPWVPHRLASIGSDLVISFLDRKYSAFQSQLRALKKMVELSHRTKSEATTEYVFRIHEISKRVYYDHELPEFYATVLQCAKILSSSLRSAFMRDVFDHALFGLDGGYWSEAWWANMTMRDIVKHYVSSNIRRLHVWQTYEGRGYSKEEPEDDRIFQRAVSVMQWDIALADLSVFYYWVKGSVAALPGVVQLIRDATTKGTMTSELDLRGLPKGPAAEGQVNWPTRLRYADTREDVSRLGILLRAGEYMSRAEESALSSFGEEVRDMAFAGLNERSIDVRRVLHGLSDADRNEFFFLVERQDYRGIMVLVPGVSIKDVRHLVPECCTEWDREFHDHIPVSLPAAVNSALHQTGPSLRSGPAGER